MKVLFGIAVVFIGVAAFVTTRPAETHVERTATVKAPADVVFAQVDDFHQWAAWSPWDKLDPTMKKTYSGPSAGTGANYAWLGNDKAGEGSMTITKSRPNEELSIRLVLLKPWQSTNVVTFSFKPSGDSTVLTWTMDRENNFMMKAVGIFTDMDKSIGVDFERGLAALTNVAEAEAHRRADEAKQNAEERTKKAADVTVAVDAAAMAPAATNAHVRKK
ncbi:MAG: SRPBCC family protein [Polyangia bacterium]